MSNTGHFVETPKVDAKTSWSIPAKRGWWDIINPYFLRGKYTKYDGSFDKPLYSKNVFSIQWFGMWTDLRNWVVPRIFAFSFSTAMLLAVLICNKRLNPSESPYLMGAVALDAFTGGTQTTTTSKSLGHTATGSNVYVTGFSILHTINTNAISGVKWDPTGLNLTATSVVTKSTSTGNLGTKRNQAWGVAIGTGAGTSKNMVATLASASVSLDIISFTGASQIATPDSGTAEYNPTGTSPYAYTVASVTTANSMLVGCAMFFSGSGYSGGTNTTVDGQPETSRAIFHSTTLVSTGSQSLSLANSGDDDNAGVVIAIPPPTSTTYNQTITEASTWTDVFVRRTGKLLSEASTSTDVFIRQLARQLTESSVWTDVFTGVRAMLRTMTESPVWTDVFTRQVGKLLAEASTWTDVFIRRVGKILVEASTWTDALIRSFAKILVEASTWTDNLRVFLNGFLVGKWRRTPRAAKTWNKTPKHE